MGCFALPLVRSKDELRLPACRGRCNNLRKHAGFAPNRLLIRGCTPMTWSFRRAVLVLTAVAVLSSMAFLGHGYAQREPRGLRVQLQPGPGAGPAQPGPEAKDG